MKSVDRVRFITHKGKQVLLLDFTNCAPEEVKSLSDEAERIITAQPHDSVLVLADFAEAQFSREAVARIKEVTTHDRPFVKRGSDRVRRFLVLPQAGIPAAAAGATPAGDMPGGNPPQRSRRRAIPGRGTDFLFFFFWELPGSSTGAWDNFNIRKLAHDALRHAATAGDLNQSVKRSADTLAAALGIDFASGTAVEKTALANFGLLLAVPPGLYGDPLFLAVQMRSIYDGTWLLRVQED
jgi:hypothetical protein